MEGERKGVGISKKRKVYRQTRKWAAAIGGAGLALCAISSVAVAQAPAAGESHARIELIADHFAMPANRTIWVGLEFRMDPGWHIYWRNAGDSGEPPKVQWELPAGFTAGEIRWPEPVRLGSGSVIDYGYEGQALLLAPITVERGVKSEQITQIAADVKYVVCREICIPGKAHLQLALPEKDDEADKLQQVAQWRELLNETRRHLPRPAPLEWRVSAESRKDAFVLVVKTGYAVSNAKFFPLEAGQIQNSAPQQATTRPDGFEIVLKKSDQLVKPVSTLHGLVVVGPQRAYEIAAPVTASRSK
jgi:DsbC/DsbD-like thiol-disulfide interchange protein